MSFLADELAKLSDPGPSCQPDPEEFGDFAWTKNAEPSSVVDVTPGRIRRHVTAARDDDPRYRGRKVAREELREKLFISKRLTSDIQKKEEEPDEHEGGTDDDDSSVEDQDVSSDDEDSEQGESLMDEDGLEAVKRQNKKTLAPPAEKQSFESSDDDTDKGTDDDDDSESDEDDDDDVEGSDREEEEGNDSGLGKDFNQPDILSGGSGRSGLEEVEKGKCTVAQLGLWDSLLKARILLRQSMGRVNRLPQPDTWSLFQAELGEPFHAAASDAQRALKTLLDSLLQLQTVLLASNKETEVFVCDAPSTSARRGVPSVDPMDEEIPSDPEMDVEMTVDAPPLQLSGKRKRRVRDYPELLAKRHKAFEKYRNDTIAKWSERVSSKGFSAFEESAVKQIKKILTDRTRLIARTHMKRSAYHVLGKQEENRKQEEVPFEAAPAGSRAPLTAETDREIFDDDDFYQHLMREVILRQRQSTDDPLALSRQLLEMQRLKKSKKNVDTRASKGRRIRYDVHKKLLGFTAPVRDPHQWQDERRFDVLRPDEDCWNWVFTAGCPS